MTKPTCYHVSPIGEGWQARYDHEVTTRQFGSRNSAIEAARDAAEMHWQMSGLATCVQIEDDSGAVIEDVSFGVLDDHA